MVHIGEIIHELIKKKGLTAKEVAEFMNMSQSNLFAIYKKQEIDTHKLGRFSELLNKNLFTYYISEDAHKVIFAKDLEEFENKIMELQRQLAKSDEKIKILTDTIEAQKLALSLYKGKK